MECLENDKLYQTLCKIKHCPALLLGVKSMHALENYIFGYIDACIEVTPNCDTILWYNAFLNYVAKLHKIREEHFSICTVIKDNGYDDSNGVDYFMDLLERFSRIECKKIMEESKPSSLSREEVRIFRLDISKATELIGKHLKEHREEYFNIPSSDAQEWVYIWSKDNILTCAVCNDRNSATKLSVNNEDMLKIIEKLPVLSTGERIVYETFDL